MPTNISYDKDIQYSILKNKCKMLFKLVQKISLIRPMKKKNVIPCITQDFVHISSMAKETDLAQPYC